MTEPLFELDGVEKSYRFFRLARGRTRVRLDGLARDGDHHRQHLRQLPDPVLLALPSVAQHRDGPVAVWTGDVVAIIAAEILLAAAAVGLGMYLHSRRADFV
jgi:hypothetical protein